MSTRANVVLRESYSYKDDKGETVNKTDELWLYRHSDGYPEGVLPTLNLFTSWIKDGHIRGNLSQGSGWLIVIGAMEYASIPEHTVEHQQYGDYCDMNSVKPPKSWKMGAYEITTGIHGDIEYLYEIDLTAREIRISEPVYNKDYSKKDWKVVETISFAEDENKE